MIRGPAHALLALLGLVAGAQSSRVTAAFPEYVALFLDAERVVFDFEATAPADPGLLARLDPGAYPDYAAPAAGTDGWARCLELPRAGTRYRGSPEPPRVPRWPCRFAPTRVVRRDGYRVRFTDAGSSACRGALRADASLLLLSNTRWRVSARVVGSVPQGVSLAVLPLTYRDPTALCHRSPLPNGAVSDHEIRLGREFRLLAQDPGSDGQGYGFRTNLAAVQAVPLLFYLELDLASLDPGVLGGGTMLEVEFLVRGY